VKGGITSPNIACSRGDHKDRPYLVARITLRSIRATGQRFRSARRISELIDAALEGVVERKRLAVGEREELHQNHTCNAAHRVEPIVGIVDSAPAQAAGGPFAGDRVGGDQESEPPFIAPVGNEREIIATLRERGLLCRDADRPDVVLARR